MIIHVDGDACPVKNEVIAVAKKYHIDVNVYIDVNHIYKSVDVKVITVDQGPDSVDMAIVNTMRKGDLVITEDYGLAALVLGKGGLAMSSKGKEFTNDNIDMFLFERHMHKEIRMQKKRHKGPKKRSRDMNGLFKKQLDALILILNK